MATRALESGRSTPVAVPLVRPLDVAVSGPYLSVVIPAYNEERRLPTTLRQMLAFLTQHPESFEVLVVDDGSADGTSEVVKGVAARDERVRLVRAPHRGKGASVRRGVLAARGERIVFCDADLSWPLEALRDFPALVGHNLSVAIGSREGKGARRLDEPFYRHLMGRVFNFLVRSLAVGGIEDTQCGFKCFTRTSAQEIFSRQTVDGFGFDVEVLFLARKLGFRVREVPIHWSHRASSRVDPVRDTVRMVRDVLRVRWNDLRGVYGGPARSGAE